MSFDWKPCDFILKKTDGAKEFHHKIEKMSMVTTPDQKEEELSLILDITMEKKFMIGKENGRDVFMWHKSTIIPMINVGVEVLAFN